MTESDPWFPCRLPPCPSLQTLMISASPCPRPNASCCFPSIRSTEYYSPPRPLPGPFLRSGSLLDCHCCSFPRRPCFGRRRRMAIYGAPEWLTRAGLVAKQGAPYHRPCRPSVVTSCRYHRCADSSNNSADPSVNAKHFRNHSIVLGHASRLSFVLLLHS